MKEITTSAILGILSLASCLLAVHLFEEKEEGKISGGIYPTEQIKDKTFQDNAMQTLTKDYPPSTMKKDESGCF